VPLHQSVLNGKQNVLGTEDVVPKSVLKVSPRTFNKCATDVAADKASSECSRRDGCSQQSAGARASIEKSETFVCALSTKHKLIETFMTPRGNGGQRQMYDGGCNGVCRRRVELKGSSFPCLTNLPYKKGKPIQFPA
jgi:hypothetical protein